MVTVRALAVAMVLVCAAQMAAAEHTYSPCDASRVTMDAGAATLYAVQDDTGTWLYFESNGHAGLQRGGLAFWKVGTNPPGEGDPCWDVVRATGEQFGDPDTILLF